MSFYSILYDYATDTVVDARCDGTAVPNPTGDQVEFYQGFRDYGWQILRPGDTWYRGADNSNIPAQVVLAKALFQ